MKKDGFDKNVGEKKNVTNQFFAFVSFGLGKKKH